MRLSDFEYALPPELVAQRPASPRDASRLLVLDRSTRRTTHRNFRDIGEYLRRGDTLVVNDTRVIPARLRGRRRTGGGAVELLLLRPSGGRLGAEGDWEALARPGRRLPTGTIVEVGPHSAPLEVVGRLPGGRRVVRLLSGGTMLDLLRSCGEVPLPPYIRGAVSGPDDYQTVYAREEGAVAAPTAGLHFTPELLSRLRDQGVGLVALTLHIGIGTFQSVRAEDVREHRMEAEHSTITPEAAAEVNARRGRLVAVGTSAVRALETASTPDGRLQAYSGWTDLFITPGYAFRAVQGLVTNFHLPRTTLLMLVCAFAGREAILQAYAEAVRERYRFYSFGDAMLIL
ncbi:MAG: tRNA preQ1(34) S-adenosylmethionine ribosyltransferase-isomerase QueA [Armatimonadetes bacterium]|nr:tRNA preQ1(34) S-adenosylmethionine ribosyltransferase-isomerase QueA [Armatimonadota bacterium]